MSQQPRRTRAPFGPFTIEVDMIFSDDDAGASWRLIFDAEPQSEPGPSSQGLEDCAEAVRQSKNRIKEIAQRKSNEHTRRRRNA